MQIINHKTRLVNWKRSEIARIVAVGFLSTTLTACAAYGHAPSYRYRMTVEIDTPWGLHAGSSVIEVQPRLKGEHAADMPVDGEAVAVDLPGGRAVYALLRAKPTADWANWIVLWLVRAPESNAKMSDVVRKVASTRSLLTLPKVYPQGAGYPLTGEDARPIFVTFGDSRQPKTVRFIHPDRLDGIFGKNVKFRKITFEITSDPVTRSIITRLPWLADHHGSLRPASMDSPQWERELSVITEGDFIRNGY